MTLLTGFCACKKDGTKFDSSKARNAAFEFILGSGQVIKGWEQVIPKMSLGMIVQIEVPSALAYGRRGYPPIIPGEEPLKFEIELISFN